MAASHNDFNNNRQVFYHFDYDSVVQFISKNKFIQNSMQKFEQSDETSVDRQHIESLYQAIQSGHLLADVFSDHQCQLYSLYLLKCKRISLFDFLTVNIYLIGLMQCTNKQTLNEKDSKKLFVDYEVLSLDEKMLKAFIEKVAGISKGIRVQLNEHFEEQLSSKLHGLPSLSKIVIKLSDNIEKSGHSFFHGAAIVSPFILEDTKINCYYLPSAHFIDAMLDCLYPNHPVKMAPILGNIGFATLAKLHKIGVHPIALYSPDVRSNPLTVHNETPGPLPILVHDLFHLSIANIIPNNIYDFLYDYFVPELMEKYELTYDDIERITENNYGYPRLDLNKAYLYQLYNILDVNITGVKELSLKAIIDKSFLDITYNSGMNHDQYSDTFKRSLELLLDFKKNAEIIKRTYGFTDSEFAPVVKKINKIINQYQDKIMMWFPEHTTDFKVRQNSAQLNRFFKNKPVCQNDSLNISPKVYFTT